MDFFSEVNCKCIVEQHIISSTVFHCVLHRVTQLTFETTLVVTTVVDVFFFKFATNYLLLLPVHALFPVPFVHESSFG
jgi:hypothetical protein